MEFVGKELNIKHSKTPFIHDGKIIGYPFSLSDAINKYGKDIIPSKSGWYHLFYENRLIYVGMSKNLKGRLLYHLKSNEIPFDNVLWFVADESYELKEIFEVETKMIKKHIPSFNTSCLNIY